MQQRYNPSDDRDDPADALLGALEMQVRALQAMGLDSAVRHRLRRLLAPADGAGPTLAEIDVTDADAGLQIATLLQALVVAERRASGAHEKRTVQQGRAVLGAHLRRAVARRETNVVGKVDA